MNVVHLMSTSVFSGAENVACQIMNFFKNDKNFKMTYLSEIGNNEKNLKDRNINYYKLKKFNYKNVKSALDYLKPDIIHAHDIKSSIIASLFSKKAIVISHVHANHENMRKICLKTFLYNIVRNKFSKIIWVSDSAYNNYIYKNKINSKSIVLYNVIDSTEIKNKILQDKKEYPQYDFIYLGRMTYQKDPIRLVEIVNLVKKNRKNIKVAFVGNGDMEEEVKKTINDYSLQENIDFYGFVSNPYKILNTSKFMIMASRYEGTPMCALEAMALGKPIISTPTDGLKDIITDGYNGYIVSENKDFEDKIIYLLENEKILENLQKQSEKKFEEICNIKKYKEKIKEIYNQK